MVGDQCIEALQAQRQVRATFRAGDGVDLVDDDGVHVHQRAGGLRGEHEIEGLGRGDEHVRWGAQQFRPFGLRGVATADTHGDRGDVGAGGRCGACDPGQRDAQVALHIHTEGLERGDIEDTGPLARGLPCPVLHESGRGQPRQRPEEGGERLTGTGRGDDEGMLAATHRVPRLRLHDRRLHEDLAEPGRHGREEAVEGVRGSGGRSGEVGHGLQSTTRTGQLRTPQRPGHGYPVTPVSSFGSSGSSAEVRIFPVFRSTTCSSFDSGSLT